MKFLLLLCACFAWAPALARPSTPARHLKSYMIYPKYGEDTAAIQATLEALIAPAVPRVVRAGQNHKDGAPEQSVLLWMAHLGEAQLRAIQAHRGVNRTVEDRPIRMHEHVMANTSSKRLTYDPYAHLRAEEAAAQAHGGVEARGIIHRLPRREYELPQLSQPRGFPMLSTYDLEQSKGLGVTVYVIDEYFNLDHTELRGFGRSFAKYIIQPPPEPSGSPTTTSTAQPTETLDPDRLYHGNCAASKAVGNRAGAAPYANLVVVEYPVVTIASLMSALDTIAADVTARNRQGKAVVSFSGLFYEEGHDLMNEVKRTFRTVFDLDVPIVVAAGNYGGDISMWPSVWADELPFITVGAVDVFGVPALFSQGGPLLTTTAGGVGTLCASHEDPWTYRIVDGTSFAAPLVAGVVAYWLGCPAYAAAFPPGWVAQFAKNSVIALSYPRGWSAQPVLYNGAHDCLTVTPAPPTWPGKRQDAKTGGLRRGESCDVNPTFVGPEPSRLPMPA